MPGRSGLLAALCFLLRSNRTRTSNKSSSFAAIFFVFRVTASVKLYLTISAAYAAYSGSFFLCSYLLYKNEVTLTKMPKYDLIFQVSSSLCFSCRASTKGDVRQTPAQEGSRHICKHPETTIPAFANPTGAVRPLFSLAYIICLKK